MRRLAAAAGTALLRSALRQVNPGRRSADGLHEREPRQHRAGQEDQAEQAHRGPKSVQDEPNPGRAIWFPAHPRERPQGVRRCGTATTSGAMMRTAT